MKASRPTVVLAASTLVGAGPLGIKVRSRPPPRYPMPATSAYLARRPQDVISPMEGLRITGSVEIAGLRAPPNEARAQLLLGDLRAVFPDARTEGGKTWMTSPACPTACRCSAAARTGRASGRLRPYIGRPVAPTGALLSAAIAGERPISFAPFSAERFAMAAANAVPDRAPWRPNKWRAPRPTARRPPRP